MSRAIQIYTVHERIWHWFHAFTITVLMVTGSEIRSPQSFHVLGFQTAVITHNVFAGLLLFNAVMGLFYFLTSGKMRQYFPGEYDFFHKAYCQLRYYSYGMFRGEPHPMEPTPDRRLNPLQKLTYLVILNILLPLQVVTGLLLWSVQTWPAAMSGMGGGGALVPLHALGSWLFLAFTIMHVYLTTTGNTPLENIRAMITGLREQPVEGSIEEVKS